jgi:hypothetical protein
MAITPIMKTFGKEAGAGAGAATRKGGATSEAKSARDGKKRIAQDARPWRARPSGGNGG